MRVVLMLATAALTLAACNQKPTVPASGSDTVTLPASVTPPAPPSAPSGPAAPAPGFVHDKGADVFGYYLPAKEVKVGNWRLTALSLGQESEFVDWEAGKRTATYAPVMLEFEDLTSPTETNELGQKVHKVTTRVLPTSYAVSGGKLAFAGQDAKLGAVGFAGSVDLAKLKALKAKGPNGGPETILTGDLKVGSTEFKGLNFTWFGGD